LIPFGVAVAVTGTAFQYAYGEPQGTATSPDELSIEVGPVVPLPIPGYAMSISASADPDNPDRLLACTFEDDGVTRPSAVYVSLDAGNTWIRTLVDWSSRQVAEESCAAGTGGQAYFVASASDTSHGGLRHENGTMEAFKSFDNGLTWTRPRRYPFVDYTALGVVSSANIQDEKVYLFGNAVASGFGDAGDGGWLNRQLMAISEDGLHYSLPKFPSDKFPTEQNAAAYPIGAVVTTGGDVLALFAASKGFALYRSDHNGYVLVSTVQLPPRSDLLAGQMAIDRSDKFRNRIYVAFPSVEEDQYALRLAVSDDAGKTWRLKTLLRGGIVQPLAEADGESYPVERRSSFAGIAVNPEGILGIEWQPPGGCPIFAMSVDGGALVAKTVPLGECREGEDPELNQVSVESHLWTMNSYGYSENRWQPGVSIYVESAPLWSVQIAADSDGRFHLFWDEQKNDGKITLMSVTIVSHRGRPTPDRLLDLTAAKDFSGGAVFELTNYSFNSNTATFSLDLDVRYPDRAVPYPSLLELVNDHSDCGKPLFLNPFAKSTLGTVVFRVPKGIRTTTLFPGDETLPVHLEVRVAGCENDHGALMTLARRSARPYRPLFSPLSMQFRVFVLNEPPK
jgi:hypothetical protein